MQLKMDRVLLPDATIAQAKPAVTCNLNGGCMFTISYKGFYINGYQDRSECVIVYPRGGVAGRANNLTSAKSLVTRLLSRMSASPWHVG